VGALRGANDGRLPARAGVSDARITAAPAGSVARDVLDTPEAGQRIMSGGVIRLAGYALGLIASVLAASVMMRYLSKSEYGRFGEVSALVTTIQFIADLGMTNLGLREYAIRQGADRERFLRVLLGMRLAASALVLLLAGGLALALGYDEEQVVGALLMGVAVSIVAVGSTFSIPLQADIRMGALTGIDVGRQIATGAAYVALAVMGASITWFLGVSVPIAVAVLLAILWCVRGTVPLRPSVHPREWAPLLKPTIVVALASAIGGIYVNAAMVLTGLVATPAQTADFAAAFRVFIIVATFPALLATTAFPLLSRAARDDRQRLQYAAQRLMEGAAVLGGAALVGLVLGAPFIMAVLGSAKYADAVPVLQIMGCALALTFVISSFGFTLLALHRHRAIVLANVGALTVSATTVLLLGGLDGARGAAVGVLLGEAALAAGYLVALGHSGAGMRPVPGRAVRVIPAVLLALACGLLPVPALAATIIALAVYAGALLVCDAIPEELRDLLPGASRSGPLLRRRRRATKR
jgi:O-antigen/teichoic acid export membrane protein